MVKPFAAPAILTLPSGVIHAFLFRPGTEGWVVTVAESYAGEILRDIDESDVSRELVEPIVLHLEADATEFRRLSSWFDQVAHEFRWGTLGRVAGISALLRLIFIAVARLQGDHATRTSALGGDAILFARFRALVEAWFSEQRGLTDYARALGVTEKKLNRLCHAVAGQSPIQLIHARLAIEAKRGLLYTSMSVAEIGYALGFRDPAYFSRFFRRHFGVAPKNFLTARGTDLSVFRQDGAAIASH
jgi:AraC family transcriptional activator of pobA